MGTPNPIIFPFKGLDTTANRSSPALGTTPDALNVRPFDPILNQLRGGRRPAIASHIAIQLNPPASLQAMTKAVRAASYDEAFADRVLLGSERAGSLSAHILDGNGGSLQAYDTGDTASGAAADSAGNVYLCGTRSTTWTGNSGNNASVWKLDNTGAVVWVFDTGATANELVHSPSNDRVIVVGNRNTGWTGSGGANRSVWCLNASTGAVVWTYDTGADVQYVGVSTSGRVYVCGSRSSNNTVWCLSAAGTLLADYDTGSEATRCDCLDVHSDGRVVLAQRLETTDWEGTDTSAANIWILDADLTTVLASYSKQTVSEATGVALNIIWSTDDELVISGPRVNDLTTIKFEAATGNNIWSYDAGDHSDALDTNINGNIVIGFDRNTGWTGSGGANASALQLDGTDGSVVWDYDTGERVVELTVFSIAGAEVPAGGATRETSLVTVAGGTIKKVVGTTVSTPIGGTGSVTTAFGNVQLQNAYNKVFVVDGTNSKVFNLVSNTVSDWDSLVTDGTLQPGARLIALYRGRIVLSGVVDDPNNWFMSRVGDPFDWDYSPATTSALDAVAGNNSQAGLVGDVVTALIPFGDDLMIIGGDSTIWQMTGDPAAGGSLDMISDQTGIAFGRAWAKDPSNTLYFMGIDGIYRMRIGGSPESLTTGRMDAAFGSIDLSLNRVQLEWNFLKKELWVIITPLDNTSTVRVYVWDQRTDSWWPDAYDDSQGPAVIYGFDGEREQDKLFLLGCRDGWIRAQSDTGVDDSGFAIPNHVQFTQHVAADASQTVRLGEMVFLMGENSGAVAVEVYAGETADQLVASTTPRAVRVVRAGRNAALRNRVRAYGLKILLRQSGTAPQHTRWALERCDGNFVPAGRARKGR